MIQIQFSITHPAIKLMKEIKDQEVVAPTERANEII